VFVVQRIHHYILLKKTTIITDVNPFKYVLTRCVIGDKYNKWVVILQELNLEFQSTKSKKYLVFAELISEFLSEEFDELESFPDELYPLISSFDPWYGDILIYLHTLKFPQTYSRDERRHLRYNTKNYLIINDTLYRRGIDSILR